jgi:Mrp family chromosome partitioning ATPase
MRSIVNDSPEVAKAMGNVVVVTDRASPSKKPARPKLALNLALGLILGGMLGFGAAAMRSLLDSRLRTPEAVANKTGLACLALLPPLDHIEEKKHLADRARSPIGMGYLRSHFLRIAMEGEGRRIIGFTPSRHGDDISRLVAGLAILLAQADRRTLVVDLNRKSPRIASMLGIEDGTGLSRWLNSKNSLKNCVAFTEVPALGVLGFGKASRNIDDLLGRSPLAVELPSLLAEWDFILVASPAIRFDWTMMLTLPSGSPIVIASNYSKAKAGDVMSTVQRARTTHWIAEGVVLQNCPRRVAGTRTL